MSSPFTDVKPVDFEGPWPGEWVVVRAADLREIQIAAMKWAQIEYKRICSEADKNNHDYGAADFFGALETAMRNIEEHCKHQKGIL